jgi:hypothetical protein
VGRGIEVSCSCVACRAIRVRSAFIGGIAPSVRSAYFGFRLARTLP